MLALFIALSLTAAPAKSKPKPKPEPAPAAATDPTTKARQLFTRGQTLYGQARYSDAIAAFEEAYVLKPHPVILFNVGKCWEQLGETAKALRSYRDYLRLLPDATDKDTVSDAIANLERRLKEKGVQQLMVFAEPADAKIEVDGKPLGSSPASVELTAGNHMLTVKKDGFEPVERAFVMSTQRATEMTITLRPVTEKKEEPVATASAPAAAVETKPVETVTAQPEPRRGRVFTWVAAGLAVVGVGSGATFGYLSSSAARQLGTVDDMRTRMQADLLSSQASSYALIANISWGVAGAAAVVAVLLFFLEGR